MQFRLTRSGPMVLAARFSPMPACSLMLIATLAPCTTLAQAQAPAHAASAPAYLAAPTAAMQRLAQGPFRIILSNAKTTARPKVAATAAGASARGSAASAKRDTLASAAPHSAAPEPAYDTLSAASGTAGSSNTTAMNTTPASPVTPMVPEPAPAQTPVPMPASVPVSTQAPVATSAPVQIALVPVKQDPPVISGALLRDSPSGTVKVAFAVQPDGSTTDIKVAHSNNRRLNKSATAAVANWRFQPIPQTRLTEVEIVFAYE